MSAIETVPPPEGSYKFVLRRYDKACIHKIAAYTYDEPTESRAIELDGVTAHTLFLSTEPARDYHTKLGWIDETAKWMASLRKARPIEVDEAPAPAPAPLEPPPGPTDAQLVARAVDLITAAGKPMTIGQLIAKLGAPEAQVRAALRTAATDGALTERGAGSIVIYGLPA